MPFNTKSKTLHKEKDDNKHFYVSTNILSLHFYYSSFLYE